MVGVRFGIGKADRFDVFVVGNVLCHVDQGYVVLQKLISSFWIGKDPLHRIDALRRLLQAEVVLPNCYSVLLRDFESNLVASK